MDIPKIPATFTGSGDLFAALFLAHEYLQSDMKATMEKTINSLYSVLLNTYEYFKGKLNFTEKYFSIIVNANTYLQCIWIPKHNQLEKSNCDSYKVKTVLKIQKLVYLRNPYNTYKVVGNIEI